MQTDNEPTVAEFFESHVEDYEAIHYGTRRHSFMTVRHRRVLDFVDGLELAAGAKVLDAGCGPGLLLEALAARRFHVTAFDASPAMVERTRTRLSRQGTRASLAVADIERLPFRDESFDLVCSTGVIEYLREDSRVLSEFLRVLRPSGSLVLPVTNAWSPVNCLEPLIESTKRVSWICRPLSALSERVGLGPIRPRLFPVRRHRPASLRRSLVQAGLELRKDRFFYFMPWPRPVDRVLPGATEYLGSRMEGLSDSFAAPLAEGYLTLSAKPVGPVHGGVTTGGMSDSDAAA
jgi:ubiquinone/menaquinone biosynthesis C-methylase UbiE